MRILLVSLFLPHPAAPHAGARFVFELLQHLSVRHQVTLATRHESAEGHLLDDLRPFCTHIHPYAYRSVAVRGLLDNLRLIANYLGFSRFADGLIKGGGFDLVQVEWVEAGVLIRRHNIPMILDAHDVLTKPFRRTAEKATGVAGIVAAAVALAAKVVEVHIMRRFDRIVTRSKFDRDFLQLIWPQVPVAIVPHPAGLDLNERHYERSSGTILFLASYRYRSVNVAAALWFCREVFPLVHAMVPGARFIIAGYGPPPELMALAEDPQVEVTGFVEDLDRCHKEADVFVAPILTGGGIIVKLLDALAAATPTVSTTFGNEGVGAVPGRDLLIADAPSEFAAAVVRLLLDRVYADRIGQSGRSFVRENYGREAVMAGIDTLHAELVCAKTGRKLP